MHKSWLVTLLLCVLALPLFAAETPEAMATRIRELEKANVAMKQDMAETQLVVDTARTDVKALKRQLEEAQTANKALRTDLDAMKKQQAELLAALQARLDADAKKASDTQQNNANSFTAVNARIDKVETNLTAQAQKHDKDIADVRAELAAGLAKLSGDFMKELNALKESLSQQIAALRGDLDKERTERLAADVAADQARAKLDKDIRSARTTTYVMGAVLGGLSLSK